MGPEKKKLILKIVLKDISPHIGKQVEPNASFTIETDKDKNSNVLISYTCNKSPFSSQCQVMKCTCSMQIE